MSRLNQTKGNTIMDIRPSNTSPQTLIKKIEAVHNVNIKNYESENAFLVAHSGDTLVPKQTSYPTYHSFSGLDGDDNVNYVLEVSSTGENEVYEVVREGDSYENDRTLTEIFVLVTAVDWGEELYFAVYAYYGLKNCIPEPHPCNEIYIWAERQWHEEHRNMPANNYVQRADGENNEFETIELAYAHIKKLLEQDYPLEPHEVARPQYFVTY